MLNARRICLWYIAGQRKRQPAAALRPPCYAGAAGTVSGKRMPNLESNDNGVLTAYEAMNLDLRRHGPCGTQRLRDRPGRCKSRRRRIWPAARLPGSRRRCPYHEPWKVDDAATQQLTSGFYTNWVKAGQQTEGVQTSPAPTRWLDTKNPTTGERSGNDGYNRIRVSASESDEI